MVVTKQLITNVQTIIKEALKKEEFITLLSRSLATTLCTKIDEEISQLKEEINDVREECKESQSKVSELEIKLEQKIDNIEQYSRRKNLRLFGLAEKQNEDTEKVFIEHCKNKLKLDIVPADIDRCHRIGKKEEDKIRPIFIKFVGYKKKMEVFQNKKKLKGTGQSIREDMTQKKLHIFKQAVETYGLKKTWTKDGITFIDSNGKKMYRNQNAAVHI